MGKDTKFTALGKPVFDIPPPLSRVKKAICRTPDELRAYREKIGMPRYALHIYEDADKDAWLFSNDYQDMVAAGLRWHVRGCSVEQYPVEDDEGIEYCYRINSLPEATEFLYEPRLWRKVGADLSKVATPEILTKLRQVFFELLPTYPLAKFCLLDFSSPDGEAEFLQDWANEIDSD